MAKGQKGSFCRGRSCYIQALYTNLILEMVARAIALKYRFNTTDSPLVLLPSFSTTSLPERE